MTYNQAGMDTITTSDIKTLIQRVKELREALRPFVEAYSKSWAPASVDGNTLVRCGGGHVTVADFERAIELLEAGDVD